MALFTDALVEQIIDMVVQQHRALALALGVEPHAVQGQTESQAGPLRVGLQLLLRVANGELARSTTSRHTQRKVEEALDMLLEVLTSNATHMRLPLPDGFWHTEIGLLTSRVRWWLSADDLITISNAAALAFGENTQATRMRIARAIEAGQLDWFPDPSVANPQHSRRVLRPQVERLRDLRQLPT